jgi:RNA polymerase sigma-70 factor, ECF subfamily
MKRVLGPSDWFRQALTDEASARILDEDGHVTRILSELFESGRSARPSVELPFEVFVAYLAKRFPPTATSVDAFKALRIADLYLACACARGDSVAVSLLDATYISKLGSLVPLPPRVHGDDVEQAVREKLLFGRDGAPPKIADYSGRGDIASWIRVVAVRTSLNLARGKNRDVPLDEDDLLADRAGAAGGDLELGHLKALYRSDFREAFGLALASLPVRDRNMLRQHYIDGVPMHQIAAAYQVHRITVVRRMKEVRSALAAETRRLLKVKLRVSRGELESIMRLIQSQFDVSLRAYLREDGR